MVAFVTAFSGAALARPTAFSGVQLSTCAAPAAARFSMDASRSVPFLDRPAKLDGSYPGDAGFDPLGFSNLFEMDFLREAEIKHGMSCDLFLCTLSLPILSTHVSSVCS